VNASSGLVTAVAAGIATITVTTADGSFTDTCTVTVTTPTPGSQPITLSFDDLGNGVFGDDVTSFDIKKNSTPAENSKTINVLSPALVTWDSVEWFVDGVSKGSTPINVAAADYSVGGHSLTVTVTTSSGVIPWSASLPFTVSAPVTGITLNKSTLSLLRGGSETLSVIFSPSNASNQNVNWSSTTISGNGITVSDAVVSVSATATGSATITATSVDGNFTANCTVLVAGEQSITLSFDDLGNGVFDQSTFTIKKDSTVTADLSKGIGVVGTWDSITWSVDGVSKGSVSGTSITVEAADYSVGGHSLTVTVINSGVPWSKSLPFTVTAGVTGVSLNKSSITLYVGGTETLSATVAPANAANKAVTWSSGGVETVAKVNVSSGLITAVAPGTAVITVTSSDNPSHTASCTVTVMPAQPITLSFADPGEVAFSQENFTIKKTGSPASQLITVANSTVWTSVEWFVDGISRTGTYTAGVYSITIDAADYSKGGHSLTFTGVSGSVPYSKSISFTVTE
jgi:uncharacterized protein YjdB